jgi:hypothetical protein
MGRCWNTQLFVSTVIPSLRRWFRAILNMPDGLRSISPPPQSIPRRFVTTTDLATKDLQNLWHRKEASGVNVSVVQSERVFYSTLIHVMPRRCAPSAPPIAYPPLKGATGEKV